jgi:hypothetical protein
MNQKNYSSKLPKEINFFIIIFSFHFSQQFRENSLQMVLFALMTFPSTYFDITTCVSQTTKAANDRKKRVRQVCRKIAINHVNQFGI